MQKNLVRFAILIASVALISCGGKKESATSTEQKESAPSTEQKESSPPTEQKETASSVAQKWCDLNAKEHNAAEGDAKKAAREARQQFEKDMQEKYKNDQPFLDAVGKEVEKCEDASEGR